MGRWDWTKTASPEPLLEWKWSLVHPDRSRSKWEIYLFRHRRQARHSQLGSSLAGLPGNVLVNRFNLRMSCWATGLFRNHLLTGVKRSEWKLSELSSRIEYSEYNPSFLTWRNPESFNILICLEAFVCEISRAFITSQTQHSRTIRMCRMRIRVSSHNACATEVRFSTSQFTLIVMHGY